MNYESRQVYFAGNRRIAKDEGPEDGRTGLSSFSQQLSDHVFGGRLVAVRLHRRNGPALAEAADLVRVVEEFRERDVGLDLEQVAADRFLPLDHPPPAAEVGQDVAEELGRAGDDQLHDRFE